MTPAEARLFFDRLRATGLAEVEIQDGIVNYNIARLEQLRWEYRKKKQYGTVLPFRRK